MKKALLKPEPLSLKAFHPFGDVIECATAAEKRDINYGNTIRYHNLARLDLGEGAGHPIISIFRSTPLPRPVPIKIMERHPLSSQAFYPLDHHPYLVVVAPAGEFRQENIKVFLAGPRQGVNYYKGTWHHFSLALDHVSEFLVVDREGPEKNCDEVIMDEKSPVFIDY